MPPPDPATIRQHALAQRDICRTATTDPYDPLVALWTAIADAATILDPDLHPSIRKGPAWTRTPHTPASATTQA